MSLQKIIDRAETVVISRNKLAGSTVSRSGRLRTSVVGSSQPFRFTVKYAPMAQYEQVRDLLEDINSLDTVFQETVDIGSTNAGLSWITEYKGDLSTANMGNLSVAQAVGTILVLNTNTLVGTSPTDYAFRKGDYIQLDAGYKYPYTVTQDVQVGIVGVGSQILVPLSRGFIEQTGYTTVGAGIVAGTDVRWQVKMLSKPNFTLEPARYINFNTEFELMEVIEG